MVRLPTMTIAPRVVSRKNFRQSLVNHLLGAREFDLTTRTYNTCIGDVFDLIEDRILEMGGGVDVDTIDLELPPHGWLGGLGVGLIFDKEKMKLLLEQMLAEVGVRILYGTDIVDVVRDGERLMGVIVSYLRYQLPHR